MNNAFEHIEHPFGLALAAVAWRCSEAAFRKGLTRLAIVSKASDGFDERWRITRPHDYSRLLPLDDL